MAAVPPRGVGPHAFVADLDVPVLDPDDHHHLARALRLRPGDPLTLSDGRGRWRRARFGEAPTPDGEVEVDEQPVPAITVALTPVKGQRPEWAVQKLTELGADAIWLLVADRSVVRWEGERAGPADRLARVAREAAMQCRRTRLPEIRVGVPVAEAAATPGAVLAHPGGGALSLARPTVLIGPEGGWSDAELEGPAPLCALGPTVLRAETAAVVAGTLLTAARAELVTLRAPARTHNADGG